MQASSQNLIARRYPALASRDYLLFIIGQLISVIGWLAQTWKVPVAAVIAGTICLLGIVLIRLALRKRVNHRLNVR